MGRFLTGVWARFFWAGWRSESGAQRRVGTRGAGCGDPGRGGFWGVWRGVAGRDFGGVLGRFRDVRLARFAAVLNKKFNITIQKSNIFGIFVRYFLHKSGLVRRNFA